MGRLCGEESANQQRAPQVLQLTTEASTGGPGMSAKRMQTITISSSSAMMFWSGWIRTNEWRIQSPLPYRLATLH